LFELGRVHGFVRRYVPRRERARVTRVGAQIGEVIATFFRGRLLVCLLKGAVLVVGLALAGFDYALLLGLAGGFLSLVPFVGPMLTGVVAFLIGLGDHGFVYTLVATVAVFTVAELVEGYVLIPKILGDSLGLHPVVILVSVFAGGAALGMFGFLIAIPLTATLVILAREFVLPVLAQLADDDWEDPAQGEPAAGSGG
jgi:predicted PurR-regulated permease PerM